MHSKTDAKINVEKNMKIHGISTKNHPKIDDKIDIACVKKTNIRKKLNMPKPHDSCSRIGVAEDSSMKNPSQNQ